jgi:putative two-component system response regulator
MLGGPLGRLGGLVLVVDDAPVNVALLEHLLSRDGHTVLTAADGLEALSIIERERPEVVLTDVVMPGIDGYELCRAIKSNPTTRLTPVVLVTSLQSRDERLKGINAGADDFLIKPVNPHEVCARVRSLLRLKRYTDELDSAEAVIMSLARTVEARNPYTLGHCQRLSQMGSAMGTRLGLGADEVSALTRGGVLHDLGKIGIPDSILLKPAALTVEEFDQMKQHAIIGDRLCSELRCLQVVRPIVRHHHERLDGSGYPDGLRGSAVPLLAQIIGVVDVYDAITTQRPYKHALPPSRAFEILASEVARGWRDPELVKEFITTCESGVRPS